MLDDVSEHWLEEEVPAEGVVSLDQVIRRHYQ